jgi:hypothetical protein
MKLITEEIQNVEVIEENVNGEKSYKIRGTFLQAECVNRNNRYYPASIMEKAVQSYNDKYLKGGRALGELNHPVNSSPGINLERVSHMITSLERKGNSWFGEAKLLKTPMGKIASSLVESGVTLGVSSRGLGSLRPSSKGYNEVGPDFMLATAADIVHDPSAPDAFVAACLEGIEWIYDASRNEWIYERVRRKVDRLVESRQYEEKKLELFNEFLNSL